MKRAPQPGTTDSQTRKAEFGLARRSWWSRRVFVATRRFPAGSAPRELGR